jgi:hypothetical protein
MRRFHFSSSRAWQSHHLIGGCRQLGKKIARLSILTTYGRRMSLRDHGLFGHRIRFRRGGSRLQVPRIGHHKR